MSAPLILASRSAARKKMLRAAGLKFRAMAADVDEEAIASELRAHKASPRRVARALAREKAVAVSRKNPRALVIGADQVLACGGEILTKAKNGKDAARKLKSLRGKKHVLISAACCAENGRVVWSHADQAVMTARDFDGPLLRAYLQKAGPALTRSVGAMELEGLGAWMIARAQGDFFTILGLPLLPLLGYLIDKRGLTP